LESTMNTHLATTGLATLAAAFAIAGCAGHHDHAHMRDGAMPGAMSGGPMAPNAAPTAPARVTAGVPVLSSGYKKQAAPPGAAVYFANLRNGMVVSSPVQVVFGLSGMGVAPAGVEKAGTGHHHLLIDVSEWDANAPLPATDNIRHFGGGQTEATLSLAPGPHTLQLVLGDQNHIPHFPVVMSERITITVR
jgi:hypothetical protein